jgi:hypothetical protein
MTTEWYDAILGASETTARPEQLVRCRKMRNEVAARLDALARQFRTLRRLEDPVNSPPGLDLVGRTLGRSRSSHSSGRAAWDRSGEPSIPGSRWTIAIKVLKAERFESDTDREALSCRSPHDRGARAPEHRAGLRRRRD